MAGHITSEKKYVDIIRIPCYHVDGNQQLRPESFMDIAQETAHLAAGAFGFGYDELMPYGTIWVLSRLQFKCLEVPHWRDEVEIATWHKGPHGPFYVRDFTLKSPEGKMLVVATSSWVILNMQTRRMMRTTDVVDMIPDSTIGKGAAMENMAERLVLPRGVGMERCSLHVVGYSDVDLHAHTNNARYAAWAMDCIDYGITGATAIKDFCINFNHETRPGDAVALYRCHEEGLWYIEGKVGDRQAFVARITF